VRAAPIQARSNELGWNCTFSMFSNTHGRRPASDLINGQRINTMLCITQASVW
jgi:hypothetical protein